MMEKWLLWLKLNTPDLLVSVTGGFLVSYHTSTKVKEGGIKFMAAQLFTICWFGPVQAYIPGPWRYLVECLISLAAFAFVREWIAWSDAQSSTVIKRLVRAGLRRVTDDTPVASDEEEK
jgi:hypothetical protein